MKYSGVCEVPCKGCSERSQNCHGTCERYKQSIEEYQTAKENVMRKRNKIRMLDRYTHDRFRSRCDRSIKK